jgi:CHAT domain-containing protein
MRLHAEHPAAGFAAAALVRSERGRARSLLEMLTESGAAIRRGVDAELLEREHELERRLSAQAEQQTRLLSGKHAEDEVMAVERELATITVELEHVRSRIRETSPQYAALMQPSPLDLNGIQKEVLDEDTILLEYSLGAEKSYLWAVTPSIIDSFELPGRLEIESAARRIYALVTARDRGRPNPTRVQQADRAYFAAAMKLSRMLLGPVAAHIKDKRLLIVGEGVLQYIPFGALPEPSSSPAKTGRPLPLMIKHEIVTAPSASVIAVLRKETAGRKPASKAVAVLADPVFSRDDPRVAQERIPDGPGANLGIPEFVRLRFSRAEAENIARLVSPRAMLKALDFAASRDTVLRPDFGEYRIVHFATHSIVHNKHPELSGIVLSMVDKAGRPRNGILRLYDIYNLKLGADLVVLSACRTAAGEEIKGEGLIGLTRGFLYAGASRVVATLWEIDDRTTTAVMKRFYEGLLGRGERPAAALRAAQIATWKTKGWEAPYYWGAFTFQGEWRWMQGETLPGANGHLPDRPSTAYWPRWDPIVTPPPTATSRSAATSYASLNGGAVRLRTKTRMKP